MIHHGLQVSLKIEIKRLEIGRILEATSQDHADQSKPLETDDLNTSALGVQNQV